jgi:DNA-binding XRE family transcriptional regulator
MGRPEEPLERDGSPVREFAFWLRDLRNRSGLTYQQLARAANYGTSTMQAAAAGRTLPTLKVTLAFVTACHGDTAAWRDYWTQIKRSLDADSPLPWPVEPSWAVQARPPGELPDPPLAGANLGFAANGHPLLAPGAGQAPATGRGEPPGNWAPDGWYVESFSALLRLDGQQAEAVEHRVIVATVDDLRELATSISVPRHPGDPDAEHRIEAELLYGGSLELREQPYESYFRNVISLARPLRAGERHEYGLLLRVPPGQPMSPHYVYVPFCRSDYFELRVRFSPTRLPQWISVLAGTPPAVIYDRAGSGETVTPDRFGEVRVEFRDLRLGRGYGLRWQDGSAGS